MALTATSNQIQNLTERLPILSNFRPPYEHHSELASQSSQSGRVTIDLHCTNLL